MHCWSVVNKSLAQIIFINKIGKYFPLQICITTNTTRRRIVPIHVYLLNVINISTWLSSGNLQCIFLPLASIPAINSNWLMVIVTPIDGIFNLRIPIIALSIWFGECIQIALKFVFIPNCVAVFMYPCCTYLECMHGAVSVVVGGWLVAAFRLWHWWRDSICPGTNTMRIEFVDQL